MQQQFNQMMLQLAAGMFGGKHLKEQKKQTEEQQAQTVEQKKQTETQAKEAKLWDNYRERMLERAKKDFSKTMVKDSLDAIYSDPEAKKRLDEFRAAFDKTTPKSGGDK